MLGIKYPILQGGMLWLANAELAAAVSNAGALGVISPFAGMERHGDPSKNENFYGHGEDLLAVADGIISHVQDGVPENIPTEV